MILGQTLGQMSLNVTQFNEAVPWTVLAFLGGGVNVCKPSAFTARSAFLELVTVHVVHTFVVAERAGETPLPHAPGVRMT